MDAYISFWSRMSTPPISTKSPCRLFAHPITSQKCPKKFENMKPRQLMDVAGVNEILETNPPVAPSRFHDGSNLEAKVQLLPPWLDITRSGFRWDSMIALRFLQPGLALSNGFIQESAAAKMFFSHSHSLGHYLRWAWLLMDRSCTKSPHLRTFAIKRTKLRTCWPTVTFTSFNLGSNFHGRRSMYFWRSRDMKTLQICWSNVQSSFGRVYLLPVTTSESQDSKVSCVSKTQAASCSLHFQKHFWNDVLRVPSTATQCLSVQDRSIHFVLENLLPEKFHRWKEMRGWKIC